MRAVKPLSIGDVVVYAWPSATAAFVITPPRTLNYRHMHPWLEMPDFGTFLMRRLPVFHASPESPQVAERDFYQWVQGGALTDDLYMTLCKCAPDTFWHTLLVDGEAIDGAPWRAQFDLRKFTDHMEALERENHTGRKRKRAIFRQHWG